MVDLHENNLTLLFQSLLIPGFFILKNGMELVRSTASSKSQLLSLIPHFIGCASPNLCKFEVFTGKFWCPLLEVFNPESSLVLLQFTVNDVWYLPFVCAPPGVDHCATRRLHRNYLRGACADAVTNYRPCSTGTSPTLTSTHTFIASSADLGGAWDAPPPPPPPGRNFIIFMQFSGKIGFMQFFEENWPKY